MTGWKVGVEHKTLSAVPLGPAMRGPHAKTRSWHDAQPATDLL